MNNQLPVEQKICQEHNQQLIFYDEKNKSLKCEVCVQKQDGLILLADKEKQYQELLGNESKEYVQQIETLHNLKAEILEYQGKQLSSLKKIIEKIDDQVKNIESQKQQLQKLDVLIQYSSVDDLKDQLKNIQQNNEQILNNINNQLKNQITDFNNLFTISNKIQNEFGQNKNSQQLVNEGKQKEKIFMYELIQNVTNDQAINDFALDEKNNTLITAMDGGIIKIYEFKNGKIGEVQQILKINTRSVLCLCFMKGIDCFVSGTADQQITVWSLDLNKKWTVSQDLNNDMSYIICLTKNFNDDMLISGSSDKKTVQIWRRQNRSWKSSQIIQLGIMLLALSLNDNGDKLLACGSDMSKKQIKVMNIQSDQKFKIVQVIDLIEIGCKLCFTFQNQFVFQSETQDYLTIYDYDDRKKEFFEKQQLKTKRCKYCNYLFPCQYSKTSNTLIVKHGQLVHIFKMRQGENYELIQTIIYQNYNICGRITDDGQYLITYDKMQKSISVRSFKQIDL